MSLSLARVADIAQAELYQCDDDQVLVSAVSLDSSELDEGSLFAALPGTRVHGAKYAAGTPAAAILTDAQGWEILKEAKEQRPVVVVEDIRTVLGLVASAVYGDPSSKLTVIGITGTSGKTTTSYLLEAGLLAAGKKVGLIGTTGTRINGKPVPTKLTTPEAPKLQALFARMVEEGVTHVVMEVSSHALMLGRVTGTHFAAAGFTNLSQDHLDFHSTMEEYFEAKALFFDPASPVRAAKVVICVDDSYGEQMAQRTGGGAALTTVTTGDKDADVVAREVETDSTGGQHFKLAVGNDVVEVALPLPGFFNVANASLATTLAHVVGIDIDAFVAGIAGVGVPGRMEKIDLGQPFLAVVDYAHKPAAVAAVLRTVREQVPDGRVGVVVGAGGDRDAGKRPIMGAESVKGADLVIVTDDNPRSEDPAAIRSQVLAGAQQALDEADHAVDLREVGDRRQAIVDAVNWAEPGDVIVVAGKGHEVGQLVGDVNHHFDDREEVRNALVARGFNGEG